MPIIGEPLSTQSWKPARPDRIEMPSSEKTIDRMVNVSPPNRKRPTRRAKDTWNSSRGDDADGVADCASPAEGGGGVLAEVMGKPCMGKSPR